VASFPRYNQDFIRVRYRSRRLMHDQFYSISLDDITSQFLKIVCRDPELDWMLDRVLALFAEEIPTLHGDYLHHDGWRGSVS